MSKTEDTILETIIKDSVEPTNIQHQIIDVSTPLVPDVPKKDLLKVLSDSLIFKILLIIIALVLIGLAVYYYISSRKPKIPVIQQPQPQPQRMQKKQIPVQKKEEKVVEEKLVEEKLETIVEEPAVPNVDEMLQQLNTPSQLTQILPIQISTPPIPTNTETLIDLSAKINTTPQVSLI